MRNILVDAGPLIAFFSPTDRHRARFERTLAASEAEGVRLVTTWPCIVEASYLLEPVRRYELLRWIEMGGVEVYPFDVAHLADMVDWMQRYTETGKREMDLADASLYWLAAETGITQIMTVDHRDFEHYRLPDGRGFQII